MEPRSSALQRQESEVASELRLALEEACLEAGVTLSSAVSPMNLWVVEDHNGVSAGKLASWLNSARKRPKMRYSSAPKLQETGPVTHVISEGEENTPSLEDSGTLDVSTEQDTRSVKDMLGRAKVLDISSGQVPWHRLLHVFRTEHVHTEEDDKRALEVTVNSGGLVYFLLFGKSGEEAEYAASCIKFSPSRIATQSEQLGLELARHLGVLTPQSRVIHSDTSEWTEIRAAVEKSNESDSSKGVGEGTHEELLETLSLSRCLLLMGYVHGRPLLQASEAFAAQKSAQTTAATLGRILVLDLVLRNEDRFACHALSWRGNSGNLLVTNVSPGYSSHDKETLPKALPKISGGKGNKSFRHRKAPLDSATWMNSFSSEGLDLRKATLVDGSWTGSSAAAAVDGDKVSEDDLFIVAIDSGVPRRPPSLKTEKDKAVYPKFVELLLNDETIASEVLQEISGGNLGVLSSAGKFGIETQPCSGNLDHIRVVKAFQQGFRAGIDDVQRLQVFMLKLFRTLNWLLKDFVSYMASFEEEKDVSSPSLNHDVSSPGTSPARSGVKSWLKSKSPENDDEHGKQSSPGVPYSNLNSRGSPLAKSSPDSSSKPCRETWHGKLASGRTDGTLISMRLTLKLKDVNKNAKVDVELSKQLNLWDEKLQTEVQKICKEHHFSTGFLDGGSHSLVDSYELKVRLDHLLDRMKLILQGSNTERPSCVLKFLYIGSAMAAISYHTLKHLGVTHVVCLCRSELSEDGEYPESFCYKSFQVKDVEEENIGRYFEDSCSFIDAAEKEGGVALVHCFEGKSRSAAFVLAYLMMRRNQTLLQAWAILKAAHPASQPNDGFMKILICLDKQLHGNVSMDWQKKKPVIRMCPVCGKSSGISNTSLRNHLRRSHPTIARVPTADGNQNPDKSQTSITPLENVLEVVGV